MVEGEVERGKRYTEADFNKIIEIKEREGTWAIYVSRMSPEERLFSVPL